jgi:hypothetical protein
VVASPISLQKSGNVYAANWFTPETFGNATNTFPATTYPSGMAYTFNTEPMGYYQFGCMDRAGDYIARIRVLVRSWDETSDFTAQSNPYNPLSSEPEFGTPYHDYHVWDDAAPANGGDGFPGFYY